MECDMELIYGKKTTPRCFNNVIGKVIVKMEDGSIFDYYYCKEHKRLAEKTSKKKILKGKWGESMPIKSVEIKVNEE